MFRTWFAKPTPEPEQSKPKSEPLDIFAKLSTHAPQSKRIRRELLDNPFQVTADSFRFESGQAMDSGASASAKQAFTLGQQRINQNLLSWYIAQSFIGYQSCALISQQWLVDKACSIKGRDAVRKGFDIVVDGVDLTPKQIKYIEKKDRKFKLKRNLEEADRFKNINGVRHVLFVVIRLTPSTTRSRLTQTASPPAATRVCRKSIRIGSLRA